MTLFNAQDVKALRKELSELMTGPVTVDLYLRKEGRILVPGREPCETCETALQIATEVAALSDAITLNVHDVDAEAGPAPARLPALFLSGAARGQVRYFGLPSGYEVGTLLRDVVYVSSGNAGLSPDTRDFLAALTGPVHLQVFVTPTCPYCPQAAAIAHAFAVESDKVTADVVEISEFPDMARAYRVQGVPKTVIERPAVAISAGGRGQAMPIELVGAQPEAALLDALRRAVA